MAECKPVAETVELTPELMLHSYLEEPNRVSSALGQNFLM